LAPARTYEKVGAGTTVTQTAAVHLRVEVALMAALPSPTRVSKSPVTLSIARAYTRETRATGAR